MFKGILFRLYWEIFRFKKSDQEVKISFSIIKKNLAYLTVFVLSFTLIISNFHNRNQVYAAPEQKAAKTIVSHLIQDQLGVGLFEELIEETYSPGELEAIGQERYDDGFSILNKKPSSNEHISELEINIPTIMNEDGVAVKPKYQNTEMASITISPTKRTEVVNYTVQKGDVVSTIASYFGISVNTILWANNLTARSLIRPGDVLIILPETGLLHTVKSGDTISKIAKTYGVKEDDITNSNQISSSLKIGDKIMVPGAKKAATVAMVTPPSASSGNTTGLGIIKDIVKGPDSPGAASAGGMLWPTIGGVITQYYSWSHTGLDIANKIGTPLYASDAGVVEFSGWSNGGYGYNVVINHGAGKKTRYAHASELYVSVGDQVARGEHIAAMGSTGRSTGSHIHFEVMINGVKQNPLNYISK